MMQHPSYFPDIAPFDYVSKNSRDSRFYGNSLCKQLCNKNKYLVIKKLKRKFKKKKSDIYIAEKTP